MSLTMTARRRARHGWMAARVGHGRVASLALVLLSATVMLLLATGAARAQSASMPDLTHPLSLDEIVRLATTRNLQVAQARESWASARGGRTSAWAGLLPNLQGSVGFNRTTQKYGGPVINTQTGQVYTSQTSDNYSLGFNGGMNLIDLPSIYSFRGAGQSLAAAGHGFDDAVQSIVLSVKQQYYALTQSQELARVAEDSYTLRTEQQRRAESLFQLGSVAKSDVLQAQVNLSAAEREKIGAENQIDQERARLAMMLALPVDSRLEVEPPAPVDETAPMPTESELGALAERQRPDLQRAAAALEAARSSERAARFQRWPSLGGSYSYSKQNDNAVGDLYRNLDQDARWGFSIGLSQTIFDGFQTKGSIQRGTADRRGKEQALEQQRLQAALDIRESLLGLKNASEWIRSAREGVGLAEESARLQKALYEAGGGTLLEWNNAQVELTRAKVAVVEAEASYHMAEAALERAVGGPLR
jgi:outer membrane protein